jgi:hypothetical protein
MRAPAFDFFNKEILSVAVLLFFIMNALWNIYVFKEAWILKLIFAASVLFGLIITREALLNIFDSRDYFIVLLYFFSFVNGFIIIKKYGIGNFIKILYYNLLVFLIFSISMLTIYPEELFLLNLKNNLNPFFELNFRLLLPGFSSLNASSITILIILVLNDFLIKSKQISNNIISNFTIKILCISLMYFAGTRTTFYLAILYILLNRYTFFKLTINYFNRYWYLIPIFVIIINYIFYTSDIFNVIKRENESISGFNRYSLFIASINSILENGFVFLIGNGIYSSKNIVSSFQLMDESVTTSHNAFLQFFISFGLIGLVMFVLWYNNISKNLSKIKLLALVPLLFLITGSYEASPSYFTFEPTYIFIYFFIYSQSLRKDLYLSP